MSSLLQTKRLDTVGMKSEYEQSLLSEIERLKSELAECHARRTLGGIPPTCDQNWANLKYTPPPDSASDPNAPPLHRLLKGE
jgi:hypothetical protein